MKVTQQTGFSRFPVQYGLGNGFPANGLFVLRSSSWGRVDGWMLRIIR